MSESSIWQALADTKASDDPAIVRRREDLRNAILVQYLPMVKTIARKMAYRLAGSIDAGDLESLGVFGMMSAIESFDHTRGFKFGTYAQRRVNGAMLDGVRDMDDVPRLARHRAAVVHRVREQMSDRGIDSPTREEMLAGIRKSERCGKRDAEKILDGAATPTTVSLSKIVFESDSDRQTTGAMLLVDDRPGPDDRASEHDAFDRLLVGLDRTERAIVTLRFRDDMRMRDIGLAVGVTESRVSQILSNTLKRIKAKVCPC